MSTFRTLTDTMLASPQITVDDVARAQEEGVTLIINNRPEGEAEDQTPGAEIEAAAHAAGIAYLAIPVSGMSISEPQIAAMSNAIAQSGGKVLAYCRSGTRSTLLWSLSQALAGRDPAEIAAAAASAGYDVAPVREAMDMFANAARH